MASERTNDERAQPDAFEQALASVAAERQDALRELVRDGSYVEPRVVSHADVSHIAG